MKEYCYKVKYQLIKIDAKNAYIKPGIEKYGFLPVQEDFEDEKGQKNRSWTGIWAKSISFGPECVIAKWMKKNLEGIYKKEKENPDSKWIKEFSDSGYEFDEEGNIAENEAFLSGLSGHLCIDSEGAQAGVLYIECSGCVEFYDAKSLDDAISEEIEKLIKEGVIYKSVLVLKERKKAKAKKQFVQSGDYMRVPFTIAEDAQEKAKKITRKEKKDPNGQFIVKTSNGYYIDANTYSSLKQKAFVFNNFKIAKKVANKIGGKVNKL